MRKVTCWYQMACQILAILASRPDLAFTVQHLSQFLQAPRETHFKALQHVLKYVASTVGQGILLQADNKLHYKHILILTGSLC